MILAESIKCWKECINNKSSCNQNECSHWIDFEDDNNCSLVAIEKHGEMTLKEVGERLNITFVRVAQIQENALKKISTLGKAENKELRKYLEVLE